MTSLTSLEIYRTEHVRIAGNKYTIKLASAEDGHEHALIVENDKTKQNVSYHLSAKEAHYINLHRNEELEAKLLEIIKSDLDSKHL
ncbi:hypothetical protein [Marinomonas spartinae]|uniref:hypothetical protein n=1 Tax=Marinomonas spartinae TaxID=1792290 RepID=UPI0018F123D7|nr:hypothetical protein [Marinomonas spartinae]MBJ7555364.1 hypothetical protein [Marinomonas spartinae]